MDRLGGFVSLLFAIGTGYLNDDIAMEFILDVCHFYVASYSGTRAVSDCLIRPLPASLNALLVNCA